jgi:hypothetical protein
MARIPWPQKKKFAALWSISKMAIVCNKNCRSPTCGGLSQAGGDSVLNLLLDSALLPLLLFLFLFILLLFFLVFFFVVVFAIFVVAHIVPVTVLKKSISCLGCDLAECGRELAELWMRSSRVMAS